jgi:hypothetical protein
MEKVDDMGAEEIKPGAGGPDKKIVYAIIAVVVVILAVVLVAKFGFGADLLNPAGGQMNLVQRNMSYKVTPEFQKVITPIPRLCKANQIGCNGVCVCPLADTQNCGACGLSCGGRQCGTHPCNLCSNGQCIYDPKGLCEGVVCSAGLSCSQGRCVSNDDLTCGN